MKGKLIKMMEGYILSLNGCIDDPYAIVNKELAEDYGWYKLSLKNCQAIERGFDLDQLAEDMTNRKNPGNNDFEAGFKAGFEMALDAFSDKKFTEDDVKKAIEISRRGSIKEQLDGYGNSTSKKFVLDNTSPDEIIQSLQQKEWDVEIEMECTTSAKFVIKHEGKDPIKVTGGIGLPCMEEKPKLDADGCLILKRI